MMRRSAAVAFALAVSALSARAVTIQRIEVRGAQRVSARVIVAETTLREGRDYSADGVRDAVARVNRLPFIAAATYTLQNGVLVIDVTEVRRVSFLLDARGLAQNADPPENDFDYDFPDPTAQWTNAAAGARWLTRGGGVPHLGLTVLRNRHAFGKNYSAYELGWTQYDLLGSRAFVTLDVRSPVASLEEKTFTAAFMSGLPLTPSQTVTVDWQDALFRDETLHIPGSTFRELQAERIVTFAWTYDTRNEPIAPTRGTFVRVAPFRYMQDFASRSNTLHLDANGVDAAALRYFGSLSAGVLGSWASAEQRSLRYKPAYEILQGGWSH